MTQAERTRTIKYVLAESSRWLLHRRRDTKKINIPGCRKKNKKRKEKTKSINRKQGTKASKKIVLTQGVSIATNLPVLEEKKKKTLLQSRDGDLATPSAIFFLLSSATISSVTAAVVEPPPPRTNQRKPNITAWTRGSTY